MKNKYKFDYPSDNFIESDLMYSLYEETRDWRKQIKEDVVETKNDLIEEHSEKIENMSSEIKIEIKENRTLLQTFKGMFDKFSK